MSHSVVVRSLATRAFVDPRPWPILLAASVQFAYSLWRQQSWRCLIAAGLGVGAFLAIPAPDAVWNALRMPSAFHLGLFAMLLISETFDDALARQLRIVGPTLVLLACLYVLATPIERPSFLPRWTADLYPPVMAGILFCYGLLPRRRAALAIAGVILACWMADIGERPLQGRIRNCCGRPRPAARADRIGPSGRKHGKAPFTALH